MKDLAGFTVDVVDVERLARVIEEKGRPVHVNVLAREAVRGFLETHGERLYAPGARYAVGELIRLDGQTAEVRAARAGGNPKQKAFAVLTLGMVDGSERWMAAEVAGAPAQDREVVSEDRARSLIKDKEGARIRRMVGEVLDRDARFVWFQDAQGDQWCLTKLLLKVEDAELAKAGAVLPEGLMNGEPQTKSTEALVGAAWGIANDGSDAYELAAFALGRALTECKNVVEAGGQWMWRESWEAFTRREALTGPRMATNVTIPAGLTKVTPGEGAGKNDTRDDGDDGTPKPADEDDDLETWKIDPRKAGTFLLTARHYYEAWLPLSKDIRGMFPPLAAGRQQVTLRLNLVGHQESLNGWVDLGQGRIWGGKGLYEALRTQQVYPGAKLRLVYVSGREYELATRMVNKAEPIRVWRIWLENGKIKGEPFQEKRRYDIEDQVFVADARFEDRAALLQQAEEAGNSIFGLMYKKAESWWEAQGREELRVTGKQLFDEIHFDEKGRMTSLATIAWELWRRLAFEPTGNGLYRFRPEYVDALKPAAVWETGAQKPAPDRQVSKSRIKKTRTLARTVDKGTGKVGPVPRPVGKIVGTESTLWDEVRGDPDRWGKLQAAVEAYMADPAREGVLFVREKAHEHIRALLAEDRLDQLTVDEFNRHVWQIGKVTYRGATGWVDAPEIRSQLAGVSRTKLAEDYAAGRLLFEGNQTWGSATAIWGAALKAEDRIDELLRTNLRYLLYSDAAPVEIRLWAVVKLSNGFGMNSATGVLHAMQPDVEMLYNKQSVAALQKLGVTWGEGWKGDTALYVRYRDFCRRLKEEMGFESLTDVDWFLYNLKEFDRVSEVGGLSLDEAFLLGLILGRGEIDRSNRVVSIKFSYGRYVDGTIVGADGTVVFDESDALPRGVSEIYQRLRRLADTDRSIEDVRAESTSIYMHHLVLRFARSEGLFARILKWYPTGSDWHTYEFPSTQIGEVSTELVREFMRGAACILGFITDKTRAGVNGRHRVAITYSRQNKVVLMAIQGVLEQRLGVRVPSINWHEGWDPQMRVYAEDFESVGFGLSWKEAILQASAAQNRTIAGENPDQLRLDY